MNAKQIKRILSQAAFNPNKCVGSFKVVIDTRNIQYYLLRAAEEIAKVNSESDKDDHLQLAIRLLVLAKATKEDDQSK